MKNLNNCIILILSFTLFSCFSSESNGAPSDQKNDVLTVSIDPSGDIKQDNAVNVSLLPSVVLKFTQAIDQKSINNKSIKIRSANNEQDYNLSFAFINDFLVKVTLETPLTANTKYNISIQDVYSKNQLKVQATQFSFTTLDRVEDPIIMLKTPSAGDKQADITNNIIFYANKPVIGADNPKNITIINVFHPEQSISISNITPVNGMFRIELAKELDYGASYKITFSNITDETGIVVKPTTYSFTIKPDPFKFDVKIISPTVGIELKSPILIQFTKPVTDMDTDSNLISITNDTQEEIKHSLVKIDSFNYQIVLSDRLQIKQTYHINFSAEISDTDGDYLQSKTINVTTVDHDDITVKLADIDTTKPVRAQSIMIKFIFNRDWHEFNSNFPDSAVQVKINENDFVNVKNLGLDKNTVFASLTLAQGTTYEFKVSDDSNISNQISDKYGNVLKEYRVSFKTYDHDPSVVQMWSPLPAQKDKVNSLTVPITIAFTSGDMINFDSNNIVVTDTTNNTIIPIDAISTNGHGWYQIFFAKKLSPSTKYTIDLSDKIVDAQYHVPIDPTRFDLTTLSSDQILSIDIVGDTTNIAIDSPTIKVKFNQKLAINMSSMKILPQNGKIGASGTDYVDFNGTLDGDDGASLQVSAQLKPATKYYVIYGSNVVASFSTAES